MKREREVVTFAKGTDTRLNLRVNPQRRSLKGILLLFVEPHIAGTRKSETYLNPDLTKVSVTVNGSPNMLYNNGLEGIDIWEEVKGKNKTQHMNATKFYTDNKFGLLIDLRSMADHAIHENGTRLVNTKDGVQLELERNASDSGKSRFVVDQIYGPFRGKFDYIVLICPTFAHNKTYHRIGENDPRMFVIICEQHDVENWLKLVSWFFEGTNTLIILDDCAASKGAQERALRPAGESWLFCSTYRHQRLGADPEDNQHHTFLPGERDGYRSILHSLGQNHEVNL
ncbi:hypothetical protein ACROYT_G042158 [Oculina patagonica]